MQTDFSFDSLKHAEGAVEFAQSVRQCHARRSRRGSLQRQADIKNALDRLKAAMKPLRAEIARFPYDRPLPLTDDDKASIRSASHAIQTERRKLWKMQERN